MDPSSISLDPAAISPVLLDDAGSVSDNGVSSSKTKKSAKKAVETPAEPEATE